jgi:hypothetical protein
MNLESAVEDRSQRPGAGISSNDSTQNPIFNFKISGLYHRDTENTEVWGNIATLYDVAS